MLLMSLSHIITSGDCSPIKEKTDGSGEANVGCAETSKTAEASSGQTNSRWRGRKGKGKGKAKKSQKTLWPCAFSITVSRTVLHAMVVIRGITLRAFTWEMRMNFGEEWYYNNS